VISRRRFSILATTIATTGFFSSFMDVVARDFRQSDVLPPVPDQFESLALEPPMTDGFLAYTQNQGVAPATDAEKVWPMKY
jgi:hypothetical protein